MVVAESGGGDGGGGTTKIILVGATAAAAAGDARVPTTRIEPQVDRLDRTFLECPGRRGGR